ncbi:hypothetical protein CGRA01v4_06252 [Colletotrichum graminicola]|nr:hypothetical protein CGRA01v4_06252 [Colletotrichum graminicola]
MDVRQKDGMSWLGHTSSPPSSHDCSEAKNDTVPQVPALIFSVWLYSNKRLLISLHRGPCTKWQLIQASAKYISAKPNRFQSSILGLTLDTRIISFIRTQLRDVLVQGQPVYTLGMQMMRRHPFSRSNTVWIKTHGGGP